MKIHKLNSSLCGIRCISIVNEQKNGFSKIAFWPICSIGTPIAKMAWNILDKNLLKIRNRRKEKWQLELSGKFKIWDQRPRDTSKKVRWIRYNRRFSKLWAGRIHPFKRRFWFKKRAVVAAHTSSMRRRIQTNKSARPNRNWSQFECRKHHRFNRIRCLSAGKLIYFSKRTQYRVKSHCCQSQNWSIISAIFNSKGCKNPPFLILSHLWKSKFPYIKINKKKQKQISKI